MSYTKHIWKDYESGGTPITAQALNEMESSIETAHNQIASTDKKVATNEQNIQALSTNVSVAATNITALQQNMSKAQSDIQSLTSSVSALSTTVNDIPSTYAKKADVPKLVKVDNTTIKQAADGTLSGAMSVDVDTSLSTSSSNPIANSAVATAINDINIDLQDKADTDVVPNLVKVDGTTITKASDGTLSAIGGGGGGTIVLPIDDTLSKESTNAVQNKVITQALQQKADKSETTVNLLNPTLQTTTQNGITITNNGDGTYTLNGTATNKTFFNVVNFYEMKGKKYKLTGCPLNGSYSNTYALYFDDVSSGLKRIDEGNGIIFTATGTIERQIYIVVREKTIINNLVFKPMLTTNLSATYDDFVPYTGNTGSLNGDVAQLQDSKADKTEVPKLVKVDNDTITKDEDGTLHGAISIEVDSKLSTTSTNPVQNKIVTAAINSASQQASGANGKIAQMQAQGRIPNGIANNLVTTQKGYALDARQGKELDDKITAINDSLAHMARQNVGSNLFVETDTTYVSYNTLQAYILTGCRLVDFAIVFTTKQALTKGTDYYFCKLTYTPDDVPYNYLVYYDNNAAVLTVKTNGNVFLRPLTADIPVNYTLNARGIFKN